MRDPNAFTTEGLTRLPRKSRKQIAASQLSRAVEAVHGHLNFKQRAALARKLSNGNKTETR